MYTMAATHFALTLVQLFAVDRRTNAIRDCALAYLGGVIAGGSLEDAECPGSSGVGSERALARLAVAQSALLAVNVSHTPRLCD